MNKIGTPNTKYLNHDDVVNAGKSVISIKTCGLTNSITLKVVFI